MNSSSLLSVGAAGLSLVLSVWLVISGFMNRSQQGEWQKQQQELQNQQQELSTLQQKAQLQQQQVQAGRQLAEQVGPAVLKDIGAVTLEKDNGVLKGILAKYGVKVERATPAPKTGVPPAP